MWRLAFSGVLLLLAGGMKFSDTLTRAASLADYLAFRCGPSGLAAETAPLWHGLALAGHCWGCYAMAMGCALLAASAWRGLNRKRTAPSR